MSDQGLGGRLIKGAFLMILMRWSMRLSGLVSVTILARLLTPEDFGVAGMASIAIALLSTLKNAGVDLAVIRHPNPTRAFYHTAWTFQLLLGLLVAALVALTAPIFADYFNEPRLTAVLHVLALAPAFRAFANIGIADFRRNLTFGADFKFELSTKILSQVVTIGIAVALQTYWALILGQVAGAATYTLASYWASGFRPRFSFSESREVSSFSIWVFCRGLASFGVGNLHRFLAGRIAGSGAFGGYTVAFQLAGLVVNETLQPIGRALMPGYASLQQQPERLHAGFRKVAGLTTTIAFAFGFGLSAVAEEFILLLLGDQWQSAVPFLQAAAIAAAFSKASQNAGPFLTATNRVKRAAFMQFLKLALMIAVLGVAYRYGDILYVAIAFAGVAVAYAPLGLYLSIRGLGITKALFADFFRAFVSASIMYAVVWIIPLDAETAGLFLSLAAKVAAGAIVFITVQGIGWLLAGRPPSFEAELITRVEDVFPRLGAWLRPQN